MTHLPYPHKRLLIIDSYYDVKKHYLPLLIHYPNLPISFANNADAALSALSLYNHDKDALRPINRIILDKDTAGANNIILAKRIVFYNGMREIKCPLYLTHRKEMPTDLKSKYSNLIKAFYAHPLNDAQLSQILN